MVEDMIELGLLIQRLGARADMDITCFRTAEDAWIYLQNNHPDLLLLDIQLPGMSGLDLCRKIRTELQRFDVPVVIFSEQNTPEILTRLRAAGADFILSKDLLCQPSTWKKRLREILESAQAVDA